MSQKLPDNKLWKIATELTEEAYELLPELPEEERYGMNSKLRGRAFDVSSDIAEAVGAIDPRDKKYHYGLARRSLFAMQNVYKLASRTGILNIEPETMVKIDKLIDALDEEIDSVTKSIPEYMQQFHPEDKK